MNHVLAKTHYVMLSLKNILFIFETQIEIQKSEHGHRVLNHRHRKNKTLLFHVMNARIVFFCFAISHIYIVFIYCCRQISLKLTADSHKQILTSTPKQAHWGFCGLKKQNSHKKTQPLKKVHLLNCTTRSSFHVLAIMLSRTITLPQHSRSHFPDIPTFSDKIKWSESLFK